MIEALLVTLLIILIVLGGFLSMMADRRNEGNTPQLAFGGKAGNGGKRGNEAKTGIRKKYI